MTVVKRLECLGRLRPQLVRFARSRLHDSAQTEDAVQEALLAAVESIESFAGDASLSIWLTGIPEHRIVDCIRRSERDQWQEMGRDGNLRGPGGSLLQAGSEQALARRRLWEALLSCIQGLPKRIANTFVPRELLGIDAAETCRLLAVSEPNYAVMRHRARARIRDRFDPKWIAA